MGKRIFDLIISFWGIVLTSPLLILTAILVKLTSRGPVFFKQERIGKNGKRFRIYKFRTMIKDAESKGPVITRRNDLRITKFGKILRWFKIDEIPQLFNVFKGEMSIVGPRPEVPKIVALYSEKEKEVLSVKPGIVGPSQILGRHELEKYPIEVEDVEEYYFNHILPQKLAIDLEYVKNASLKTDIKYFFSGLKVTLLGAFKLKYLFADRRRIGAFFLDSILSGFSYFLSYSLRFDMVIPKQEIAVFLHILPLMFIIRPLVFIYCGMYQGVWKYTSIKEFITIIKGVGISSGIIILLIYFLGLHSHPRSVPFIDLIILSSLLFGVRISPRFFHLRRNVSKKLTRKNILIAGAGDEGECLLRELNKNPNILYQAVGFVDEDYRKRGQVIHGIKVLGTWYDIPHIVPLKEVEEVLIALSNGAGIEIKTIVEFCRKAGVRYKIVPAVKDILDGKVHLSPIREIEILDILGREPVELNFATIKKFLENKTILITGAGGSIGGELARQIATEHYSHQLILLDKTENYLYEIESELRNSPLSEKGRIFTYLLDIRESKKVEKIFERHQPQIIFHAAAYKHVPLTERNPVEAIENNIWGTQIMGDLALKFEAECFVMISTDKAVNPKSLMGVTKRIAEMYVQFLAQKNKTKYFTVRFGNVLNSKGSVIPLFQKQINQGGPVTVTHPEMERYFMTISEAAQLILQAASLGKKAEIFMLDMGKPIKIVDLVKEMIKLAGMDIERISIKYIGIRPGEKLSEELFEKQEKVLPSAHPKIKIILPQNNLIGLEKKINQVYQLIEQKSFNLSQLVKKLQEIVPTYCP